MHPIDRFRSRVAEAIASVAVTLIATVGGVVIQSVQETTPATEPTTSLSIDLMAGLLTSFPGIVSLIGIIGATWIAGPFGFVGALLEVAGANQLLYHQSEAGFWMIVFGAGLVTAGAPIPWLKVLNAFLGTNNRY